MNGTRILSGSSNPRGTSKGRNELDGRQYRADIVRYRPVLCIWRMRLSLFPFSPSLNDRRNTENMDGRTA